MVTIPSIPSVAVGRRAVSGAVGAGGGTFTGLSLRLQTHVGDYAPYGLFTDTGGSTPATTEGDLIACWRDMRPGGTLFTQATSLARPTLVFVDGVPMVDFAAGQYLVGAKTWGLDSALAVIGYEPLADEVYTVFDAGAELDNLNRNADGDAYLSTFRADRLPSLFAAPNTGATTLSIYSDDTDYTAWLNGSLAASEPGSFDDSGTVVTIGRDIALASGSQFIGRVCGIFVHPNAAVRVALEAYLAGLRTAPALPPYSLVHGGVGLKHGGVQVKHTPAAPVADPSLVHGGTTLVHNSTPRVP